jgi:hypothetical protein
VWVSVLPALPLPSNPSPHINGINGVHLFAKTRNMAVGLECSSVVQRLPSMREALGSISAPKKKRQKKTQTLPKKCGCLL